MRQEWRGEEDETKPALACANGEVFAMRHLLRIGDVIRVRPWQCEQKVERQGRSDIAMERKAERPSDAAHTARCQSGANQP